MFLAFFKKLFWLLWPIYPQRLRVVLSRYIQALQRRKAKVVTPSEVVVFSYSEAVFYQISIWKELAGVTLQRATVVKEAQAFSLIATCYNEATSVAEWLDSVLLLSISPQEVVICDGGSSDNTVEEIRQWQCENPDCPFELQLISGKRRNIAEGRNEAARLAKCDLLLCTDVGTILHPDWSPRLLTPFVENPEINCVMGWYEVARMQQVGDAEQLQALLLQELGEINPTTFLPSARSIALTKELYWRVGGYPEHLTLAGEDTLFDCSLKEAGAKFAFVPEAYVFWQPPQTVMQSLRMIYNYSVGDGEAELFWQHYLGQLEKVVAIFIDCILVLVFLFFYGASLSVLAVLLLCFAIFRAMELLQPYVERMRQRTALIDWRQWPIAAAFVLAQTVGFVLGALQGRVFRKSN
jgi:cellulose synthase/poly-beta-1,6-N-acetylglucosamine synthase-like glycosyltransferase